MVPSDGEDMAGDTVLSFSLLSKLHKWFVPLAVCLLTPGLAPLLTGMDGMDGMDGRDLSDIDDEMGYGHVRHRQ